MTPTFQGEVQMRRWSDSSTQGVQITFALPDTDALEPLKHKAGKRFMAVLVEIGDDEQPVTPSTERRGSKCIEACEYCRDPEFHRWIEAVSPRRKVDEKQAAEYVRQICHVASRKDLDATRDAGEWFINGIRTPFMKWQREQRS